ncbi:MAG: baseplate J/gp47 family protein [Dehalococcoidia bacterium]
MPLTDEGYQALRADDYLSLIREEYERLTGLQIDWDFDLFLGNITAVVADRLGDLDEGVQAVYDSRDPNNSTGNNLAILASITGANRRASTFGTVAVDLTGTAGTIVPGGSTIFEGGGDADGARWILRDSVTLDGAGEAFGVLCDAQGSGAIPAAPGAVDAIVTPVFGLDSVTNPLAATPGADRESDVELRVRRLDTLQLAGSGAAAALQAEILTIEEITAATVLENDTEVDVVIEGVAVESHSLAPIVHPPSIPDAVKEELADAIYRTVCGGIRTSGTESAEVQGGDLAPKTVRYSLSTGLTVDIVYDIVREGGFDVPSIGEISDELNAATLEFFAALNLGEDVLVIDLVCIAAPVAGVRSATVTLTTSPPDPSRIDAGGNVTVFANELGLPGAITVNEV